MRLRHSCLIAAVAGVGFTSMARATLSVGLVRTVVSSSALASDPSGLGVAYNNSTSSQFPRTFDLLVNATGSPVEQWSFGTIKMNLNTGTMAGNSPSGSFYIPASANGTAESNATPSLAFDTYVTTPTGGSHTTVLGPSDYPVNQDKNTVPPVMPGTDASTPTVVSNTKAIDISWGDQQAANRGLGASPLYVAGYASAQTPTPDVNGYRIARLTIMGKAGGTLVGHVGGTNHNFTDVPFSFTVPSLGDFNNDGTGDNGDIGAFVEYLNGPALYATDHPDVNPNWVGDFNNDGSVDNGDIGGFVQFLNASSGAIPAAQLSELMALVPEPASLSLLGLAGLALVRRRAR